MENGGEMPFPEGCLTHDLYQGITVDVAPLDLSADVFKDHLTRALSIWRCEGKRGIWLKVPTKRSHLIASATGLGFDFQHGEAGFCVLTKWLPETESRLPHPPTHQVGVGCLVCHPITGKMLVVQEKSGPAAKRKLWKMPTGLCDPSEDISDAAVRELMEETGLECEVDEIVCFRQSHGGLFGRSDLFFVVKCSLASKHVEGLKEGREIELVPQEEEILDADWIEIEDYINQSTWKDSPLYKEMNGKILRSARRDAASEGPQGFIAKNLPIGWRPGSNTIYVPSNSKL